MLLLDAALLKEAVKIVGGRLGDRLGLDVAGLNRKAIDFIIVANEKLRALLGADALGESRKQLRAWLAELQAGTLFPTLADKVLQTQAIQAEVDGWIGAFAGPEGALLLGRDEIANLSNRFQGKLKVVSQVNTALAVIKLAPPLLTPVGRLAVAATYLALLAYVVGSGYDHADSDRMRILDWVEGVRGISKRLLVAPPT